MDNFLNLQGVIVSQRIEIGEFVEFIEGADVAVVSGPEVDLVCGRLGSRPPFRNPDEMETVSFDDAMTAKQMAIRSSGVMDFAFRVGEMDRDINRMIVSKSGALAISCYDNDILKRVKQFVKELDDGNDSLLLSTYPARIG